MNRFFRAAMAVFFASGALAGPSLAAGDGGGSSDTVTQCKQGEVWDKDQKKCVVPKQGMIDDDSLYEAGRDRALAGRYGEAISVLSLAADKSDPRILNYLGYSHRKQGRVLVGLGYYQEALRANPDYTLVREYLGEAYLQLGDVDAARGQLAEIEKRCGTGCAEHAELARQIEAATTRG
jgi:tetratricopeptide (TPR) repeat protein